MALPTVAVIFDLDIPNTNVTVSEEETHSSNIIVYEKEIPKVLNVYDHIKFLEIGLSKSIVDQEHHLNYINPHLSIFSPPPEA